ncbi:MAG: hypothetical protein ACRDG6_07880 [Candidatus Limnocylindria bacterium]
MESTEIAQARAVDAPVVAAAPTPILVAAAAPEAPASGVTSDSPNDHGLTALIGALRARELALIDATILRESAAEIAAALRSSFQDLHLEDIRLDTTLAEVRALVGRFDLSVLTSAMAQVMVAARGLASARPRVHVPDAKDGAYPPRVKTIRIKSAAPRVPRLPALRVRWLRVLSRGLSLGLIAVVLIFSPPDLFGKVANRVVPVLGNVANEVSSAIGNVATEVRSAIDDRLAAAPAAPTLARASFELPPLGAYAAAFESQAPYPSARPSGTVEWVVALRNTGSVGWYRGIDGAQASLALADGTAAAVQTTPYVGPGQVGWFVVRFPAPSQPGTYTVPLLPRIDGRGPLPDLGIHATVTVSPNP